MKGFRRLRLMVWMTVVFCAAGMTVGTAQVEEILDTRQKRDVILYRGDLVSLKVYSLTRVAISTPGIVDIFKADSNEIVLVGMQLGQTQIFIWDAHGKRSLLARVIEHELDIIQARIKQLLAAAEITGITMQNSSFEAKIIATGKVNKSQKKAFDKIVDGFREHLINMVDSQNDLIQIDAQITELSTTLEKTLGVEWIGDVDIQESGTPASGLKNIFRVVNMDRLDLISATINALLVSGEAKTLSRPSIVMSDGETADMSVGGEIPITSRVVSDGIISESTEYKSYGLSFSVTPEIKDNEKVDILLNISIIDLDATRDGAFVTTETTTRVLLDDGQTIVIAGLIKRGDSQVETKVPFLSSIPVVGLLFRNKSYVKSPDREIVISLTPNIRRQKDNLKTIRELEEDRLSRDRSSVQKQLRETEGTAQGADTVKVQPEAFWGDQEKTLNQALPEQARTAPAPAPVNEILSSSRKSNLDAVLQRIEQEAAREVAAKYSPDVSAVVADYARGVQKKIAEKISFPYQAREAGWEGVVTLSLTILSNGELDDVSVEQSSGHHVFDRDAVNTAYIVAPFARFPVEMALEQLRILIPVAYRQDAVFGQQDNASVLTPNT